MQVIHYLLIVNGFIGIGVCLNPGTKMLGVNCDNKLVKRSRLNGHWRVAEGSCCIDEIAILPDKTLLGVGEGRKLYTKNGPKKGDWEGPIENSCCIRDIVVTPDGAIVGITADEKMVVRPDLESEWEAVPNSKGITAIAVYPDGRILGVTKTGALKVRPGVQGKWKLLSAGGGISVEVHDLSIQPDGTVFGIGKKSKGLHVLDEENNWGPVLENSDCVLAIVSPGNLK
ncbi:uncharacterized protein LOC144432945 [Glandiceps talaboti]